jgi:acetyltransferase-like isoleucine patch superfamily enzyme
MFHKISLMYSWFIWLFTFPFPDIPILMRIRGRLYSFVMKNSGRNFQVSSGARLFSLKNLTVGDDVFIATNVVVNSGCSVIIESQVMLGIGVVVVSGNHTLKGGSYRFGEMQRIPVKIGYGSWIGANSTLVAGSEVPQGSLIAANSVVTKKLKITGVYGGVPAKLLKQGN